MGRLKIFFVLLFMIAFSSQAVAQNPRLCIATFGKTKVLKKGEFFRLLTNPEIALDSSKLLVARLEERNYVLNSELLADIRRVLSAISKLSHLEDRLSIISEFMEVDAQKAEKLLLALSFELRDYHKVALGLRTMGYRDVDQSIQSLSRKERQAEKDWVREHQKNLYARYERFLVESLLAGLKMPNFRKLEVNTEKELDSAHAIKFDIESGSGFLGQPVLVIQGLARVTPPSTLISRSSAVPHEYHIHRFVNQLLRFKGSITMEEHVFIPEFIAIQTMQGVVKLADFQNKFTRNLEYSDNVYAGRRERQRALEELFGRDFLTLVTPNAVSFGSQGIKSPPAYEVIVDPRWEGQLRDAFIDRLFAEVPYLKQKNQTKGHLRTLLNEYVLTPDWTSFKDAQTIRAFVVPTFALPPIVVAPKKEIAAYMAREHRQFTSLSQGGVLVLVTKSKYFKSTVSLQTRLKQIIEFLPDKSSYDRLLTELARSLHANVKVSDVSGEFAYGRAAYTILRNTFNAFNVQLRMYNRHTGKNIELIEVNEILTRDGLLRALQVMESHALPVARVVAGQDPNRSRYTKISRYKAKAEEAQADATAEVPILESQHRETFTGAKGEPSGLGLLAQLARANGLSLYTGGATKKLLQKLLDDAQRDFHGHDWSSLNSKLANINIGNRDAQNARASGSAKATQRIYSYLYLLAKEISVIQGGNVAYQPAGVYSPNHLWAFITTIPSAGAKLTQYLESLEN